MKKIFLTILMLATFIFSGCLSQAEVDGGAHVAAAQVKGDLKISMLKLGKSDSILIQTGKQTILIDTGSSKTHELFIKELEKFSVTKIDKLIITHAHSDHVGGAKMLIAPSEEELTAFPYLEKISVGEVYDNGVAAGSKVYNGYLKALKTTGKTAHTLKTGETLDFGNGVKFKVLFPTEEFVDFVNNNKISSDDKEHNLNNGSIVGRLTYKNFSMMFTGDCERATEAKILANNDAKDLKCDVIKVPHHGSTTSSTKNFVTTINPSYALISSGDREENGVPTGHPYLRTLKTYLAAGVDKKNILCTRFNGTITIISDGKNFTVTPEIKTDWLDDWIALKEKAQKNKED